jgi:hypothetical protein
MAGKKYMTTDPDVIRQWAEIRYGKPALLQEAGSEADEQRPGIVFPGFNYRTAYTEVSWQELFEQTVNADLVFLYQEKTEDGDLSHYGRFVTRQVADEAVATSDDWHEPPSDPTVLASTDALQNPMARGSETFRHPRQFTAFSRGLVAGLVAVSVLILLLIATTFWPVSP